MSTPVQKRRLKRPVNGILLLDKPLGLSSNAALQHAKRLFQAEKAGHTGNLDPLATGLLPICFGHATKLCGYLLEADKLYRAHARLGARTATGDIEGEIVERSDPDLLNEAGLRAVLPRFLGEISQIPPMYSALKHQGERLYRLAREGIEVERPPRQVTIHSLDLRRYGDGGFELDVRCSKGTYIRTLIEDIAAAAGQCAHLGGLHRLEVAPFRKPVMCSLEQLEAAAGQGAEVLDALLQPVSKAVAGWPTVVVDEERAHYLSRGQAVRVAGTPSSGLLAVFDQAGTMLGMARIDDNGMVAPQRWL